nr:MAG TPA: hypothetical protein [Caudoviricetes sp.]
MNPIISILNSVKEIVTFENITFLLGLIGSVGTAWQVIQSRRKIRLSLPYFGYSAEKQLALAYIQFDNLSNSAVSITDVSIVINGITYPCNKLPTIVASLDRKIGGKTISSDILYNMSLPVCLSGYGGSSGYFVFQIPLESVPPDSTHRTFLISTSRGSSFRVELKPDREYFH